MPRSAVDRVHEVYATSYRRLVGQLTGVTGDPAEAEDAVMEALSRAVNSRRSFLAADNPEEWLRTVAVDVTRTRWRRRLVAERVEQPGFEEVVARAGQARRRRRTTIAAGLATAAVVGATAFALEGPLASDDQSPEPFRPGLTRTWDRTSEVDPRLSGPVRAVLDDDLIDLWAAAGSSGALAVLWWGCDEQPCRFVLVTRDGDQVTGTDLGTSYPRLSAVPGGWVVENGTGITRLTPSGDRTQLYVTGPGDADVMAGDTAIDTVGGVRLVRGDKAIPAPVPPGSDALTSAFITPSGRLVAATVDGAEGTTTATDDGSTWEGSLTAETRGPAAGAVVAGNGDHVAVAFLGDDPDGSVPVVGVQVSHDAGRTWTTARGLDTDGPDRVRDLSSLIVTADGTAYATTGSAGLVRIDADGNASPTPLPSLGTSAFVLDAAVCVVAEAGVGAVDELHCLEDDGTSWVRLPLPGFG